MAVRRGSIPTSMGATDLGPTELRFLLVGEAGVGKTCLAIMQAHRTFADPMMGDGKTGNEYSSSSMQFGQQVDLVVQDAFSDAPDYQQAGAVIVLYDSHETMSAAASKWVPEARREAKEGTPVLLAGTKSDLEKLPPTDMIPVMLSAAGVDVTMMSECSAKTGDGIQPIFDKAVEAALNERAAAKMFAATGLAKKPKKSSVCAIL